MKLAQASTAERNAAFDAVHGELVEIIAQWVPAMFQGQARAKLESADGRRLTLEAVDKALAAAEKVRDSSKPAA